MAININKAVDKDFADASLKEIADAPVSSLKGLSDEHGKILAEKFHIKTVRDLAKWKFAAWAQAIVHLADTEE